MGLPICQSATICGLLQAFSLFWCRSAAMSGLEHHAALPPEVPCYITSRRSTTRSPRDGVRADSRAGSGSSSESPVRRQAGHGRRHSVNKPRRRMEHARPQASPTRDGSVDSSSEDAEVKEFSPGSIVLLQAAKAFGPLASVSEDIDPQVAALIKSLLVLDKVAQDVGNPVVAQEVGKINGALALLGHANHRTNLVRRFIMRREINQK
ncbi:hypothetical protein E2C01_092434 [Portunus trituberculatus]|uniref:Uncharacterized protein n=1 Tax=Portunus trituberculatus TaxID=210409 RepID=A0A5B7JK29_PORTR|nr:hypothetical protein [Portunus trituberculatus]